MDFLKKHYEKLILAFFLLIFVFLLLYLIDLSKSTHTITKKDLMIPTREPNYKKNDFTHQKYQINYIFTHNCTWEKSQARDDKDNIYTDLMVPFECARCPYDDKVIPVYYFWGAIDQPRHCPLCGKPLPRPFKVKVEEGPHSTLDRDNDGIPNDVEIKLGLDPDNPDDAFYDMDNDGFPNVYEYNKKTNIKSEKSHPPFYERLLLIEFRETLLPFKLKLVNTNGKKDPKEWDIQINEQQDGNIKTRFNYLDSRLRLDNTDYTIVKIEPKYEEVRRGGTIVKNDMSKIFLKSLDDKYTITMQVDQHVFSPKPKAVIEDLATEKKYHVGAGDSIIMPTVIDYDTGKPRKPQNIIKYKVVNVDRKKNEVIIEDRKYKKYVITAKALMPRVKRKEQSAGQERLGENPGAAPMPPELIDAPPGGNPNARPSGRTSRSRR